MKYILEYEIAALVFLVIVTIRFLGMRKFQNTANKIFGIVLYTTAVNIMLDLCGAYILNNPMSFSIWTAYTVNTLFYLTQMALPAIMLLYVLALAGCDKLKLTLISLLPVTAVELLIVSNSLTNAVFIVEKSADGLSFSHGFLFGLLYIVSAIYIAASIFVMLKMKTAFRKTEIRTILSFAFILIVAVVIQIFIPSVLITGVAMSIAIFMMFLTMQNPETMLDSITGTFNYGALIEHLRRHISEGKAMWITAVDVGGIRRINSVMGIRVGNELLEKIGKFINSACGSKATAFRMIGTRFVIISDNDETHRNIVEDVSERFKKQWKYENSVVTLLATIRYCEQKNSFTSPEDVINLIDIAYSRTADEGFGTTKAIESVQLQHFQRTGQIKQAIRRAVTTGEGFYLNFQPLYSVKEKRYCSAEALLRFRDPELGMISPAEFIPIAESTDLIYQIDSMVIKMACDFLKSHPQLFDAGLRRLEINLSATEFNSEGNNIYNDILENIDSIEDKICFEVTETAVTTHREVLSDFMQRLIKRGVQFAIDDFGTGYANITQLAKLPFSVVKLDKIFAAQNSGKEADILCDLVNMFKHIGLSTVFEGIETEEQAKFAADLGIEQIQGFFYSRPVEGNELVRIMTAK